MIRTKVTYFKKLYPEKENYNEKCKWEIIRQYLQNSQNFTM